VVKFMVKVRLIENSVNNDVGNVIVVNVMIQNRAPGMKLATARRAWPKPAGDCPLATCCPTELIEGDSVGREEDACAAIDDVALIADEDIVDECRGHKDRTFI
jgi:hypothetical protein